MTQVHNRDSEFQSSKSPVLILCDLIADFSLRIPDFPVKAGDLLGVSYIEVGPGGATNVAITAARFGLPVACLGEVGDDHFGRVVVGGLRQEGIGVAHIVVSPEARTPVAGVIVDDRSEPAYLGYPGTLCLRELPDAWRDAIAGARALFADGWAEHDGMTAIILDAFRAAKVAGVPSFFDPGPGNPRVLGGNAWHSQVAALATAVLANEEEAERLTGHANLAAAARALLSAGPRLAVVKRGPAGCLLATEDDLEDVPGFPVEARDATGAGDSVAGAVIYGYLNGLPPRMLGILANATGAAKVQKLGTGHSMPTVAEVRLVLERFGQDPARLL